MVVCTVMAGVLITNFGCVIILSVECRPAGFWRGVLAKCWPSKIRIYSMYATIGMLVLSKSCPHELIWSGIFGHDGFGALPCSSVRCLESEDSASD